MHVALAESVEYLGLQGELLKRERSSSHFHTMSPPPPQLALERVDSLCGSSRLAIGLLCHPRGHAGYDSCAGVVVRVCVCAHAEGGLQLAGNDVPGPWKMQVGLLGEALQLPTEAGSAKVQWSSLGPDNTSSTPQQGSNAASVGALTWLKASFDAPADWSSPEALAVDLTGATKGHVYINGFDAGRYWVRDPVISTYYQLPPDNLKPKDNLLVLWEEIAVTDVSTIRVVRRQGTAAQQH